MITNKFKLIVLALSMASMLSAQSQTIVHGTQSMLDKLRLNNSIKGIQDMHYSEIDGNPYMYEDFVEGKVYMKNGDIFSASLRYDVNADQVQFKANDNIYVLINQEQIKKVEMGDKNFVYSDYLVSKGEKGPDGSGYFIVLADGKYKLLARKNMRIQDPTPSKGFLEPKPAKFIMQSDTYYIKSEDGKAVRVKSKADLVELFAGNEDVSYFLETNKIKVNRLEDLIKVVNFCNSL